MPLNPDGTNPEGPPAAVQRHRRMLHHLGVLHRSARALTGNDSDADDLVQESVKRVLERLDGWNELRNVRAYLFATLRNLHIEMGRQRSRNGIAVSLEAADGALAVPASQHARLEFWDVVRGLADLPDGQRDAVVAVGVDGLSYEEVAEEAGVPVGTVMSRLHRGRSTLRRRFDRS